MTDTTTPRRYLPGEAQRAQAVLTAVLGGPENIPAGATLYHLAEAAAGTISLYRRAISTGARLGHLDPELAARIDARGFSSRQYEGKKLFEAPGLVGALAAWRDRVDQIPAQRWTDVEQDLVRVYDATRTAADLGEDGVVEATDTDRLADALREARQAAAGDSNDTEIEALQNALELALTRWPEVVDSDA
jgi:hypothetical protein